MPKPETPPGQDKPKPGDPDYVAPGQGNPDPGTPRPHPDNELPEYERPGGEPKRAPRGGVTDR